ncbi:unnamed protein product [Symbiodinium sp. CCMP2592]|nr:unnamed protein product [Symbiodinium sp. CCMP2592]
MSSRMKSLLQRREATRMLVRWLLFLSLGGLSLSAPKGWVGLSRGAGAGGAAGGAAALRGRRSRIPARDSVSSACWSGWSVGPLGPVESALAFRIYYLPFVEPLDIDGNLLDQLFGGWFGPVFAPLLLGVLVFWIQSQINAMRREQEGKVLRNAAKAVGSAAEGAAKSAAQSLSERLGDLPKEQWLKLLVCLAIDLAGDATFLLPGLGAISG